MQIPSLFFIFLLIALHLNFTNYSDILVRLCSVVGVVSFGAGVAAVEFSVFCAGIGVY